jgi:NADP-dependent 3-hydroxy acid dehydrogenase YdfG
VSFSVQSLCFILTLTQNLQPFTRYLSFLSLTMPQLVWFITGCSSGFGAEFVRQVLSRGDKVIATARDITKIEALASQGAAVLELDVTHSQHAIEQIIAQAITVYGRIDVLVNNAGYVAAGSWEDLRYVPLVKRRPN